MLCRRCGTLNADEIQFCRHCRASLHWHAVFTAVPASSQRNAIGVVVAVLLAGLGVLLNYLMPIIPTSTASPSAKALASAAAAVSTVAPTPIPSDFSSLGPLTIVSASPVVSAIMRPTAGPTSRAPLRETAIGPGAGRVVPEVTVVGPVQSPAVLSALPSNASDASRPANGTSSPNVSYLDYSRSSAARARAGLARLSEPWSTPTGYATRLANGISSDDSASILGAVAKARGEIDTISNDVVRRQPPSSLLPLQGQTLTALQDAGRALVAVEGVVAAGRPTAASVDDATRLLSSAEQGFIGLVAQIDATYGRPEGQ